MPSVHDLTLTPSRHGLPEGWTAERFHDELERAAASFSAKAIPCTSLQVTVAAPESLRIAEEDGLSLVGFRSDQWCHNSRCGHLDTFPARAMAMTETHPASAHGAGITEADIELNAVDFRFTGAPGKAGPDELAVPLRSVLLHEIGHAVGLADRCVPEGRNGVHAAVPDAGSCGPHETESVMFAPALNLALSPLDVAALCAVHPGSSAMTQPATPGVAVSPASTERLEHIAPLAVLGLGLAAVAVQLCRRRLARVKGAAAFSPSVCAPTPRGRDASRLR